MTVTFLTVGKPPRDWTADAVVHYSRFLAKYATVVVDHVRAVSGRDRSDDDVRDVESERVAERLAKHRGAAIIVCDRRGESKDSVAFAKTLRTLLDSHGGHCVITLGGACGLNDAVTARADYVWSFGPMTLPHDLALLTAMEQVARAFSIGRGESYHK
ncbi:MAG: 23S rRNA (pseudouridine(1915)-N(3))-methyltransferase RlmH [Candidatus Zixiibacteriota bacterium]